MNDDEIIEISLYMLSIIQNGGCGLKSGGQRLSVEGCKFSIEFLQLEIWIV